MERKCWEEQKIIVFLKVRYKNYLSTGQVFTEVDLNRKPNTLVIGKNGAGKTTVLSAITFCLFNNPYRNVNLPQVINSINGRECLVEVEFRIGKTEYLVRRGLKPNIFEIEQNGKLIEPQAGKKDYQDTLEKSILKMNYKSFTQIVVLGSSAFVPFMALKASDRRTVIEEILGIQIFSAMNVITKQKLVDVRDTLERNRRDIELEEEKIKLVKKHLSEIRSSNKTRIEENNVRIKDHEAELENLTAKEKEFSTKIVDLKDEIDDKPAVQKKQSELMVYKTKIETNQTRYQSEQAFYEEHDNCPTCHQDIDDALKATRTAELRDKLVKIEEGLAILNSQLEKIAERTKEIGNIQRTIMDLQHENIQVASDKRNIESYLSRLRKENTKLAGETTKVGDEDYLERLKELKDSQTRLEDLKAGLIENREYLEMAATLLKDTGIKTRIISKYLPIINKQVNKYLSSMDFFVNFNLDENFTETIKSRHRDEFSYESFSEGEKQKIDLSLLFTWRFIAKMKNSVSTNLLILDEVFDSSLDSSGTEDLLKILQTFGTDTNIFVISHKGDQLFDKFHSVIRFVKKNNFSVIDNSSFNS